MNYASLALFGTMMADEYRNQRLAAAVAKLVHKGDVVADIGAGLGFLSVIAARSGASRVFAVERDPILARLAERLVADNGCDQQIEVVMRGSEAWSAPEAVDVVLCETLGIAVFDEGFASTVTDARDRFLKPDGRILPFGVSVFAAPVSLPKRVFQVGRMSETCGVDLRRFGRFLDGCFQRADLSGSELLAASAKIGEFDIAKLSSSPSIEGDMTFRIATDATLAGLAVWFDAQLADGVSLSNGPDHPFNHWGQVFLSADSIQTVVAGTFVGCTVRLWHDGKSTRFRWKIQVNDA